MGWNVETPGGGGAPGVKAVNNRAGIVNLTKADVNLNNVDNTADVDKPVSTQQATALALKINTVALGQAFGPAVLGSDAKLSTAQIPDAIVSGMKWQSTWNASTNIPAIPAAAVGNAGWFYKVSVAGTNSVTGSSLAFVVGDWLIGNGTVWQRVPSSEAVISVNTKTGAGVLNATDVGAMSLTNFGAGSKGSLVSGAGPASVTAVTAAGTLGQILSADPATAGGIKWVDAAVASGPLSVGDTKFSYRAADHDGWYILDGRAVSTLSVGAQGAASTLGWVANIPNTRGRFPLAASPTYTSGTQGGSNTLAQSNLPNVTLTGTTASGGAAHTHSVPSLSVSGSTTTVAATSSTNNWALSFPTDYTLDNEVGGEMTGSVRKYLATASTTSAPVMSDTNHSHTVSGSTGTGTTGSTTASHTHTFTTSSINGNLVQSAFMPAYSAKTEFVFLGS